ncbi:zinc-dependent alcohol dehydrogenase [Schnuerera sp.]|uniref:zinc-dependent alcohol dehydrogenase n=1 Tax=Schnuerera sp. TaxID=2794844 RepID=UPI002CE53167|nr:alcohol dehydrogenase catalytic domain-containing protein [Schnuerera sp.]HSH36968.1 alcohol dehydrogenase catalytic domain-containing protein [Schnuerera sp.]
MKTYKIATIQGAKDIKLNDWEMPELYPDEVKVKISACAICTSDQGIYRGARGNQYPFYPGHEVVGIVEEIGELATTEAKVGDKVVVCRMNRCGQCPPCRKGDDNRCIKWNSLHRPGRPSGPGGFAEYLIVPDYQVFKMSQDADMVSSALIEPVACCIGSVDKADIQMGDTVLVIGAGIMGLLHAEILRLRGAKVVISEVDEKRRKIAEDFADWVIDPTKDMDSVIKEITDGYGVDSIFVTAGPPKLVPTLFKHASGGASIVIYTSYYHPEGSEAPIDLNNLHYKEYRLVGTISPTKYDFARAVSIVNANRIDLNKFIRTTVPFEDISKAFNMAIEPGSYRVIVTME